MPTNSASKLVKDALASSAPSQVQDPMLDSLPTSPAQLDDSESPHDPDKHSAYSKNMNNKQGGEENIENDNIPEPALSDRDVFNKCSHLSGSALHVKDLLQNQADENLVPTPSIENQVLSQHVEKWDQLNRVAESLAVAIFPCTDSSAPLSQEQEQEKAAIELEMAEYN
ncbi:hypothetical protein CROQUDRAFT_93217 [Cronartium quercuum f. sp. fusiforme G11]|uniref:Uncharacterized protein n=1 Tax=Cronartium quercuum f. sp. fusiforme G11 TaxID=708437 RepID=A0A9P6NM35_9BASI|nr:hypothetical protein CROQUDRAFT_93217 [Cronartium quercuum f. sp. fusiforme G11]